VIFSSIEFLFVYLPLTMLAVRAARRWAGADPAVAVLTLASILFYALWNPWNLLVLFASVGFNWVVAGLIERARASDRAIVNRRLLALGIAGNLLLLFWFKYASFTLDQLGIAIDPRGALARALSLGLPLGLSFYTFQQIAYIVDLSRGECPRASLLRHQLLVSFFPHHIAGPITHPSIMLPQLRDPRPTSVDLARGLFILSMGLAKKACLADQLAPFVDASFAHPESLATGNAWIALGSYTMQLYLDFSGYSDMAVGLGLMFGVRLPWNFDSPYKAASIARFWRRWHITLSDFLKNYLYIPLGGSRRGTWRTAANLIITMLLGGIWHGAGWTFALWGLLHGVALAINHALRAHPFAARVPRAVGWLATMLVVLTGWVLFRARSIESAAEMYRHLLGLRGELFDPWDRPAMLAMLYLAIACALVLLAPNTRQWSERFRPTPRWSLFGATLFALGIVYVLARKAPPEFLYFDF
jgi:D-alanyl-lipoteichoic acid acyltransferase DltB (MBOAT superfamily)